MIINPMTSPAVEAVLDSSLLLPLKPNPTVNMPIISSIEMNIIQFGEPPHPAEANAVIGIITKNKKMIPIIPKPTEIIPFLLDIDFPQFY